MIPFVAVVSVKGKESRTFRVWIPLLLIWLLLIPVLVLLSPVILIACLVSRVNPLRGIRAVWDILGALKETGVEVDRRTAAMSFYVL
jgi:hypothetical protein